MFAGPDSVLDGHIVRITLYLQDDKKCGADNFSKLWKNYIKTARKTIGVTSKKFARKDKLSLSINHSSEYIMLQYKRANEHLFIDDFFDTKSTSKSSRGNTCMQLFVTNKRFIHLVAMKL